MANPRVWKEGLIDDGYALIAILTMLSLWLHCGFGVVMKTETWLLSRNSIPSGLLPERLWLG